MEINFLDTSAVLHGNCLKDFRNVYLSPLTLQELEGIKSSNKPEEIKFLARQAIRTIIELFRIFIANMEFNSD